MLVKQIRTPSGISIMMFDFVSDSRPHLYDNEYLLTKLNHGWTRDHPFSYNMFKLEIIC
jgi:hypothetical protein